MAQPRLHSSPYSARNSPRGRRNDDSPSRQLQFEIERALSQIHLHEIETSKLHAYQKRQQREELDAQEAAQARVHRLELNNANAQFELIRREADDVLQAHIRREEEERLRREEQERQRLAEEERRKQAEEAARRRAEEDRKAKEEEARRKREERESQEVEKREKEKVEAEEKARKAKEDADQKQREETAKAEQEAALKEQQQAEAVKAAPTPPSTASRAALSEVQRGEIEDRHKEYLALHKKLKVFRKEFWVTAKKDPKLKNVVGDMRRAMRTSIGQLTEDKTSNKKPQERVKSTLLQALKELPSPLVPVSEYLPSHLNLGDNGATTIPSMVIYLLSMFSKAIIACYVNECAVNTKQAEPVGVMAAHIFSSAELQFQRATPAGAKTQSLVPILMCKFHATAPILFGISGPETTNTGKLRLGWRRDRITDDLDSKRAFVLPEKQYDRLTGLGVGYSSIALRNFSRAKVQNPWPPVHFWASLAHIINTHPEEVHQSHLILLRAILENNAIDRFVLFFGAAGVASLRQAVIEFPKTLPAEMQEKQEAKALSMLAENWKKDKHFSVAWT